MVQNPNPAANPNPGATDIELLGGEMFTWSDFSGRTSVADGPIARGILAGYAGARRRVLVAGPHVVELVEAAVAGFESADVLVRSFEDAQALRARLPASVHVICGPLGSLARRDDGYDLVVALAGVDRLHSAEIDEASWTGAVTNLVGLLADDGELYLGFGNEVGVDRLLGVDPDPSRDDSSWPHGRVSTDPPLDLRTLAGHLEAGGLGQIENWACFGPRSAPTLAVPAALLDRRRRDAVLGRLVEHSFERDNGTRAVKDVGHTARELVVHGLGAGVAPSWVLHHARGAKQTRHEFVLVAPHDPDGLAEAPYRLDAAERDGVAGWERRLLAGQDQVGWLPSIPTVHELLADACSAQDLTTAGTLVRRYRDWLTGETGSRDVEPARVPVTLDDVVLDGPSVVVLRDLPAAGGPVAADVVLLRALLVFAHDFLARVPRHPWPRSASPEIVAWALAGVVDLEADPERLRQAVALDASVRAPGNAVPEFSVPRGSDAFGSYGEMSAAVDAYAEELAAAQAQVRWLLRNIHGRQRTVLRANRNIRKIQRSPEYRLGKRIFWFRHIGSRLSAKFRPKKQPEWKAPKEDAPTSPQPLKVDPALVPPGYKTDEWI